MREDSKKSYLDVNAHCGAVVIKNHTYVDAKISHHLAPFRREQLNDHSGSLCYVEYLTKGSS